MIRVANVLSEQSRHTEAVLKKAEQDKWEILNDIRDRERQVDRWKTRLPWFVPGADASAVHSNQSVREPLLCETDVKPPHSDRPIRVGYLWKNQSPKKLKITESNYPNPVQ